MHVRTRVMYACMHVCMYVRSYAMLKIQSLGARAHAFVKSSARVAVLTRRHTQIGNLFGAPLPDWGIVCSLQPFRDEDAVVM